ncbi:hypothetical protein ACIA03_15350 [Nocardioides sp. NPDC051685]|uniref:hypothetical protein n=1 Tax=Nocardioides sp. NPDC051685 TaxID=3364334 RepID=UPI00378DAA0C
MRTAVRPPCGPIGDGQRPPPRPSSAPRPPNGPTLSDGSSDSCGSALAEPEGLAFRGSFVGFGAPVARVDGDDSSRSFFRAGFAGDERTALSSNSDSFIAG